MLDFYGRFDLLIYGRYFELSTGPLIVLGIINFFVGEENNNKFVLSSSLLVGIFVIFGIAVNYVINYDFPMSHLSLNCPGIADIGRFNNYEKNFLLIVIIKVCLIFLLCCFFRCLVSKGKKEFTKISLAVICICWLSTSYYVIYNVWNDWGQNMMQQEENLANYIEKENIGDGLKYYVEDEIASRIDPLQFLLKDSSIKCSSKLEEIKQIKKGEYLLTNLYTVEEDFLSREGFVKENQSSYLILWKKVNG